MSARRDHRDHRDHRDRPDAPADEGADVIAFRARPAPPAERDARLRDVLGDVLRDERTRQERTLTDVARRAAVSVPYLSEVERGRKEVSSDLLDAITGALDLELAEVLERSARRLRAGGQRGARVQLLAA